MAHIDSIKTPKSKRNQATVQFPFVYFATDYHDFSGGSDTLCDVLGVHVRIDEVGFSYDSGLYVGVAYLAKNGAPKKFIKAVKEALDKDNKAFNDDDAY